MFRRGTYFIFALLIASLACPPAFSADETNHSQDTELSEEDKKADSDGDGKVSPEEQEKAAKQKQTDDAKKAAADALKVDGKLSAEAETLLKETEEAIEALLDPNSDLSRFSSAALMAATNALGKEIEKLEKEIKDTTDPQTKAALEKKLAEKREKLAPIAARATVQVAKNLATGAGNITKGVANAGVDAGVLSKNGPTKTALDDLSQTLTTWGESPTSSPKLMSRSAESYSDMSNGFFDSASVYASEYAGTLGGMIAGGMIGGLPGAVAGGMMGYGVDTLRNSANTPTSGTNYTQTSDSPAAQAVQSPQSLPSASSPVVRGGSVGGAVAAAGSTSTDLPGFTLADEHDFESPSALRGARVAGSVYGSGGAGAPATGVSSSLSGSTFTLGADVTESTGFTPTSIESMIGSSGGSEPMTLPTLPSAGATATGAMGNVSLGGASAALLTAATTGGASGSSGPSVIPVAGAMTSATANTAVTGTSAPIAGNPAATLNPIVTEEPARAIASTAPPSALRPRVAGTDLYAAKKDSVTYSAPATSTFTSSLPIEDNDPPLLARGAMKPAAALYGQGLPADSREAFAAFLKSDTVTRAFKAGKTNEPVRLASITNFRPSDATVRGMKDTLKDARLAIKTISLNGYGTSGLEGFVLGHREELLSSVRGNTTITRGIKPKTPTAPIARDSTPRVLDRFDSILKGSGRI